MRRHIIEEVGQAVVNYYQRTGILPKYLYTIPALAKRIGDTPTKMHGIKVVARKDCPARIYLTSMPLLTKKAKK